MIDELGGLSFGSNYFVINTRNRDIVRRIQLPSFLRESESCCRWDHNDGRNYNGLALLPTG